MLLERIHGNKQVEFLYFVHGLSQPFIERILKKDRIDYFYIFLILLILVAHRDVLKKIKLLGPLCSDMEECCGNQFETWFHYLSHRKGVSYHSIVRKIKMRKYKTVDGSDVAKRSMSLPDPLLTYFPRMFWLLYLSFSIFSYFYD